MLKDRRVLIVEDEALFAMDLADIVKSSAGVVIGPFRTNREALEVLARESVDAAILDLNLADGDVKPTVEHLLASGVPMLICTAGSLPQAIHEICPDMRVQRKPVRSDRLLADLRAMVSEQASNVQAASGAAPTS